MKASVAVDSLPGKQGCVHGMVKWLESGRPGLAKLTGFKQWTTSLGTVEYTGQTTLAFKDFAVALEVIESPECRWSPVQILPKFFHQLLLLSQDRQHMIPGVCRS